MGYCSASIRTWVFFGVALSAASERGPLWSRSALAGEPAPGGPRTLFLPGNSTAPVVALDVPEPSHIYVLPNPINTDVNLGWFAKAAHYIGEAAFQAGKGYVVYKQTGSATLGWGTFAFELKGYPLMVPAQSLTDLQLRYWYKQREQLMELSEIPQLRKATILSTSAVEFQGLVASKQENRGFVFLETSTSIDTETSRVIGKGEDVQDLGKPLLIEDPDQARVRLRLHIAGEPTEVEWTPSVAEVLGRAKVPREIADQWRADIKAATKQGWKKKLKNQFKKPPELRVEASLVEPGEEDRKLGTLLRGKSVKQFLRMTLYEWFKKNLPRLAGKPPLGEKSIKLGEIRVVPPDTPRSCFTRILDYVLARARPLPAPPPPQ